ncbi:hypothetical protein [Anabaena azotica]|uniref:Uncharacterized protein n=1 Tax=Anabaena azotica FACHB-119 TaxID=947527 RepID=A0ABR8DH57_9NOST|nr:hypothetical protein [Anabaena azotica]MBD2505446.1 hypothetical protein [Anabaena azotica FACHB-119]
MKTSTLIISIGLFIISLMSSEAIAQKANTQPQLSNNKTLNCVLGKFVKLFDSRTLLCRRENSEYSVLDKVSLERFSSLNGMIEASITMTFYREDGIKFVAIGEYDPTCDPIKKCVALRNSTMFTLKGRTFLNWEDKPNKELVEKYRKEISSLLDTQNEPHLRDF